MAVNMTASMLTSAISRANMVQYEKTGLDVLMTKFGFYGYGDRHVIQQHNGTSVQLWRANLPGVKTTTAPEGAVGTGISLGDTLVTISPGIYRDFMTLSQKYMATVPERDALTTAAMQMGYRGGLTLDRLVRELFDNPAVSLAVTGVDTNLSHAVLGQIGQTFQNRDVEPPMGYDGFYPVVVSPLQEYDLMHDDRVGGILDLLRGTRDPKMTNRPDRGAVIDIARCRVRSTTHVATPTGQPTKRRVYAFGKGGFGLTSISGFEPSVVTDPKNQNFRLIVNQEPNGSIVNPAGAIKASVAYNFYHGGALKDTVTPRVITMDLAAELAA